MTADVATLSERWFQAWLDKDAAVIERLAAHDYAYVGPGRTVMERAKILAVIRSPEYRLERGVRTEVAVRALWADAALVRHRYQGSGAFEGSAFRDDQRCVTAWEKLAGERRLVGAVLHVKRLSAALTSPTLPRSTVAPGERRSQPSTGGEQGRSTARPSSRAA